VLILLVCVHSGQRSLLEIGPNSFFVFTYPFVRTDISSVLQQHTAMIQLAFFALTAAVASALPSNIPVDLRARQYDAPQPLPGPSSPEERAQEVVNTFRVSWNGYYTYAFPMDELRPVSNNGSNSR
jgi:hypothetical protein